MPTAQEKYAKNLESQCRGLAVYRPAAMQAHSHRVGDMLSLTLKVYTAGFK